MTRFRNGRLFLVALAVASCGETKGTPSDGGAVDQIGSDGKGGEGGGGQGGDGAGGDGAAGDGVGCGAGVALGPGAVLTAQGVVRGAASGATTSWKGIPYATPPVGALRWTPPTESACWNDRDAKAFGPRCAQVDDAGKPIGSEDCLTLNVWAPSSSAPGSLPVLFFVHGGGNVQGSAIETAKSGEPLYGGGKLSEKGPSIVVTINYRLGPFGFLAHPALSAESPKKASGNYGILDQIAALAWVQRNIAGFGGDPKRVLLFGESAGARDTCVLYASPLAKGLFSAALMESGACVEKKLSDLETAGATTWAKAAGCDTAVKPADCMRALSADAVTLAVPGEASVVGSKTAYPYGTAIDGWVLPDDPLAMIKAGAHNHVPFVVGANSDETSMGVPMIASEMAYAALVHAQFGATLGDLVLAQYPAADYKSPRAAYVALTSDARFICQARKAARAARANQTEPVWRYFFAHALDGSAMLKPLGAWHGLELTFVFANLEIGAYKPTPGEIALSDAIIGYWTRFAATGNPNGGGAAAWPGYEVATDAHVVLDDPIASGAGVRSKQCDFWDTLAP